MKLTSNVYVETEFRGATVGYVTTSDGVVMIESPYRPSDAVKWRKEIDSRGPVKYLVHTESHADHCAGDFLFNAPVVSQEITRKDLLTRDREQILTTLSTIDPESRALLKDFKIVLPTITFSETLNLYFGRHTFCLLHHPGHTPGQTAVFIPEEKVVFTGDNISGRVQPYFQEADPFAWLESLRKLGKLDFEYIVPGHGEICDKSFIKEESEYIQKCIDVVRNAINEGLSRDRVIAEVSLPSTYPLEAGMDKTGPILLQKSVAHLYDLLSHGNERHRWEGKA
jgi:cyclase